jgi:hypothetical protein
VMSPRKRFGVIRGRKSTRFLMVKTPESAEALSGVTDQRLLCRKGERRLVGEDRIARGSGFVEALSWSETRGL